jgi:hypothetical protein
MPARALPQAPESHTPPVLAVVGRYATDVSTRINHVGLLASGGQKLSAKDEADVYHVAFDQTFRSRCVANVVGELPQHLMDPERLAASEAWLADARDGGRWPLERYRILPAYDPNFEDSDRICDRKYNCVGLVLECYHRLLGKPLINENVPRVKFAQIQEVFGGILTRERFQRLLQLTGDEWAIPLPGYVLHALHQEEQFPYPVGSFNEHMFPLPT